MQNRKIEAFFAAIDVDFQLQNRGARAHPPGVGNQHIVEEVDSYPSLAHDDFDPRRLGCMAADRRTAHVPPRSCASFSAASLSTDTRRLCRDRQ